MLFSTEKSCPLLDLLLGAMQSKKVCQSLCTAVTTYSSTTSFGKDDYPSSCFFIQALLFSLGSLNFCLVGFICQALIPFCYALRLTFLFSFRLLEKGKNFPQSQESSKII